jgi:hypothetical protein
MRDERPEIAASAADFLDDRALPKGGIEHRRASLCGSPN